MIFQQNAQRSTFNAQHPMTERVEELAAELEVDVALHPDALDQAQIEPDERRPVDDGGRAEAGD